MYISISPKKELWLGPSKSIKVVSAAGEYLDFAIESV